MSQFYKIADFEEFDIPPWESMENDPLIDYPIDEVFFVAERNNELMIEEKTLLYSDSHELQVQGGILRGTDNGEFGGWLCYLPEGKQEKDIEGYGIFAEPPIYPQNVRALFKHGKRIFVLSGLHHLICDKGDVWEINQRNDIYIANHLIALNGCPEAYTVINDSIYVSTSERIYQIDLNKDCFVREIKKPELSVHIECAHSDGEKNTYWCYLIVTSIAVI